MMMNTKTQNILVTGGAGFIGTHLCRLLTQQGHYVTVIDIRDPQNRVEKVNYIKGDIRNQELMNKLTRSVNTVYHFAAIVSVPLCQKDPIESYDVNFTGTVRVLEAIRHANEKDNKKIRLIFASTAALYGSKGDDGRALKEEDVASDFSSFYAAQKHASEKAIFLYNTCFGIPALCFRFFNVYGPGQDPSSPYSGVITIFNRLAREGKNLPLNGGGQQTRDFISVYDIAKACALALDLPSDKLKAQTANLGTNHSITVQELARMIIKITKTNSQPISAPFRDGDVVHSKADITRARELIAFKPSYDLEKGLSELLSVN